MLTRLTLIRHGNTAENDGANRRLMGRTDVPLSARGRDEVRRLQQRLRGASPFAAIYSSPLQRARATAAALADAGLGPVVLCDALQEIDCGLVDGLPLEDVQSRVPESWERNLRQEDDCFRWPGGESYREFRCRALRAVRATARRNPGLHVALVTHAGFISQLVGELRGARPAQWELYRPANGSLTTILWGRGVRTLVSFDDHAHLR